MKACDMFKCKEYKVTCNSCETIVCACNPSCEKCKYYKKTCYGSHEENLKKAD